MVEGQEQFQPIMRICLHGWHGRKEKRLRFVDTEMLFNTQKLSYEKGTTSRDNFS